MRTTSLEKFKGLGSKSNSAGVNQHLYDDMIMDYMKDKTKQLGSYEDMKEIQTTKNTIDIFKSRWTNFQRPDNDPDDEGNDGPPKPSAPQGIVDVDVIETIQTYPDQPHSHSSKRGRESESEDEESTSKKMDVDVQFHAENAKEIAIDTKNMRSSTIMSLHISLSFACEDIEGSNLLIQENPKVVKDSEMQIVSEVSIKSPAYKNKHARMNAYENIVGRLKEVKPSVTVNDVKIKFNGLKTNFLTEYKKYNSSRRSGAGNGDDNDSIYTPTLWYFNSMFFLLEHCQVRTAVDSLTEEVIPHVTSQDSEMIEYVIRDDSELQDVDSIDIEPEVAPLQPASPNQATLKGKKRKLQEEVVETKLIREASSCLASINENLKKTSSSNNEDEALRDYEIAEDGILSPACSINESSASTLTIGSRTGRAKRVRKESDSDPVASAMVNAIDSIIKQEMPSKTYMHSDLKLFIDYVAAEMDKISNGKYI
ncbi:hypothetical protein RN001_003649 [Aquatica leii]|uniref:MADF domain-containing protein n=1 Tax=Aquatica leii TaxID=1421715 RepID=A0AAN7PIW7_9COLE|nr:hypothetical protein RN001_003649 [Aquatica leii]